MNRRVYKESATFFEKIFLYAGPPALKMPSTQ